MPVNVDVIVFCPVHGSLVASRPMRNVIADDPKAARNMRH